MMGILVGLSLMVLGMLIATKIVSEGDHVLLDLAPVPRAVVGIVIFYVGVYML